MKKITFIFLLTITPFLLAGCKYFSGQTGPANSPRNQPGLNQPLEGPPSPQPTAEKQNIIIKNSAFSPIPLKIKAGTTITWVNQDSVSHQVASNPHPRHTDLPGLNSGALSFSQSYSFTFTQSGTFGYHCHLHPNMAGQIIVE